MQLVTALITQPDLQPLWVLWVVLIIDVLWPLKSSVHPLTVMRLLATNMAKKVLPANQSPPQQHMISGFLGFMVLVVPLLVVIALTISLAHYQWFFDALLLYISLGFGTVVRQFKGVRQAIGGSKKLLARERLSHLVARDTQTLSEIGIAKAAIEGLLLKFYIQFCGVIFWYCIAGGVGALGYRLVLEFSWVWHPKRPGFNDFSRPLQGLKRILSAPALLLGNLVMLPMINVKTAIVGVKRCPPKDTIYKVLALFGGGLGIMLSGPAVYFGQRVRYQRVGGDRQLRFSDMTYALRAIFRSGLLYIVLLTLTWGLCVALFTKGLT